jgi:dynein light intermediate chain
LKIIFFDSNFQKNLDELIRQVAINCAERGLLLLRVRDELQMTLRAYQTLYESSVAFGMRKALMADNEKFDFFFEEIFIHNLIYS